MKRRAEEQPAIGAADVAEDGRIPGGGKRVAGVGRGSGRERCASRARGPPAREADILEAARNRPNRGVFHVKSHGKRRFVERVCSQSLKMSDGAGGKNKKNNAASPACVGWILCSRPAAQPEAVTAQETPSSPVHLPLFARRKHPISSVTQSSRLNEAAVIQRRPGSAIRRVLSGNEPRWCHRGRVRGVFGRPRRRDGMAGVGEGER